APHTKGGLDEIFGMPIPKDLITDVIRNSEYYQKYLEMAACKPHQATTVTDEEKKKAPPAGKPKQPAPAKSGHLVDEEDEEGQPAPEPQVEDDEYNLPRGIQMSLESFQAPDASTGPSAQPQNDTSANVVRDTLSLVDAETGANMEKSNSEGDTEILNVVKEQSEDVSNMLDLEERTVKLDEG
ncbi:hypothetical protein Tco_0987137, partial [Tanacetum coccineum]